MFHVNECCCAWIIICISLHRFKHVLVNLYYCMFIVQIKIQPPSLNVVSVEYSSRQVGAEVQYLFFTKHGWSSFSLKELPSAVTVSWRGCERFSKMDDSLVIIALLSPTSSTNSRQQPRMELVLLTRLSIFFF